MATLNIGMKVNRAITGATTVNANAYAMVTYSAGAFPALGTPPVSSAYVGIGSNQQGNVITRYFGPSQSIPASFTTQWAYFDGGPSRITSTITWSLLSGVELINTQ